MSKKMLTMNDASLLEVFKAQRREINIRVLETPMSDITYDQLIPVNTNYAEWQPDAQAMTFSGVGEAQWFTSYADDVPYVDVKTTISGIKFSSFAVGWETNLEELNLAASAGVSIPDRKASIARRKAEEFIQRVGITGAPEKQWTGLVNKAGVSILPAMTKAAGGTQWVNANGTLNGTPEEIAMDGLNLILGPASLSGVNKPIIADTLALPALVMRAFAVTILGVDFGNVSILEFLRRQVQAAAGATFQIVEIPELATAATTVIAGGGRAIAYRRSVDILELPMPLAFRFYDQWKDSPLGYMVPGYARIGEVTVWENRGIRYMDGVSAVPA